MNACQPLKEYSWFIDKVRNYTKENRKNEEPGYAEKAVDRAIDEMPSDWILKQFLVEHRSEVRSMWMTEYDEQAMWDDIRAAYQEDIEEKAAKAAFEKNRADQAETRANQAEIRADKAETRADNEKSRADSLTELARRYGIPEEQIAAAIKISAE